ncbi:hypothetical protein PV08_06553 [Exophiala spinifera]|uniref:Uncharacterized protein n=1 Tax=Exophiala spinifera TaxID=91928 RepID=A0A0D2BC18_9EURO|nr:uncharacterized protein PV08_06553 [Exophiala spinifera]KIW16498.1 hypothetical protein PV08_06553 [Exophiala spinifera]
MATRPGVPQLKAPFPLKLNESPRVSEEHSSTTLCSRELRRSGTSSDDLRGLAKQHASSPTTPLLPSPITHMPKDGEDSYFGASETRDSSQTLNDAVLDKLQILSYYCNEEDSRSSTTMASLCSNSGPDEKADENDKSTTSDSFPVTPIDQIPPAFVCSDESGWLANTTSHDERRRRFKARLYQIVQHPYSQYDPEYADDQVMVATVLVGSGKPKIVQIQRPLSRRQGSTPTAEIPQNPSTPVQATMEVSAFSPYDTPSEVAEIPQSENSLAAAADEMPRHSPSNQLSPAAVPASLCHLTRKPIPQRSSSGVRGVDEPQVSPVLADPFTVSKRWSTCSDSSSTFSVRAGLARDRSGGVGLVSLPSLSPTDEVAARSTCRKMNRVLKAVTLAISNYPDGMLQLGSPSVLAVRSPNVADQIYIGTLGKIFPTAPAILLSSLAAWILIDVYFTHFEVVASETSGHGYGCPGGAVHLHSHSHSHLPGNLDRIPTKARAMLGLDYNRSNSEVQSASSSSSCLTVPAESMRNMARAVHDGMCIVSQRLIESLRGCWDEDIWRSLKVLVEVIESGHR